MKDIVLYTATWCGDCRRTKQRLDEIGVAYREVNIEEGPEAVEIVLKLNGGRRRVPTVLIHGVFHETFPGASKSLKA